MVLKEKSIINHSILSPIVNRINRPRTIIEKTLEFYEENNIPINSCEGFVRQVHFGWREFIRGVYRCKGSEERTKNFWGLIEKFHLLFIVEQRGLNL